MGRRNIRILGEDEILRKQSKPVTEVNGHIRALIGDMFTTMYKAEGVGLAGPQVGVLKRLFVVNVTGEPEDELVFINPEILSMEGSQTDNEGCLSVPGKHGLVTRAQKITVKALDAEGKEFTLTAEDFLARAIQHEYDHLDGILYVDKAEGGLRDNKEDGWE